MLRHLHNLIATLLLTVLAVPLAGDVIRLRAQATVGQSQVTLADIADLQGEQAQALASVPVGQMLTQQTMNVQIEQVREALSARQVNWGRLSLGGYARCQVRLIAPDNAEPIVAAVEAPVVANPSHEVNLGHALTVKQQLVAHLAGLHQVDGEQLQVEFDAQDESLLQQVTLGERLEIQTTGELGRVIAVVRRWRGEDLAATYRLTVQVARKAHAVVMRQSIARGQAFTDQHVALQPVLLRDAREMPLQSLESVIGLTADAALRSGAVVYPRCVRNPLLVQRNELLTVRALSGGLAITTTARALQDGVMGDTVQVRNERSREVYTVKVTGLRQATLLVQPSTESAATEGGAS